MVTGENNSETYCTKKTSNAQQFKFDTHNETIDANIEIQHLIRIIRFEVSRRLHQQAKCCAPK
jgi:hypothetical protein